jgi:poly(A) polymerase
MGREPHDYDVATDARPEAVARLFPRSVMVGARFGVVSVPLGEYSYEVTTFRSEGPYADGRRPTKVEFVSAEEDVHRRDFTINGLLHDPLSGQTFDHVGGREDIVRRCVRTIGSPDVRFSEDRLRMLRAVRLAAELQFDIEAETLAAIRAQAAAIAQISAERIRDEIRRLLTAPGRGEGLRRLHTTGLLGVILPEVAATHGVAQPPEFHPEGDVFTHTVLTLEKVRQPSAVLGMAVLLHDIGKPPTYVQADRIRFNRHDEVGARMAEEICRRLRLSNEETERIVELVREHIRIKDLPKMRPAKAKRFLARVHIDEHLELHRADCLASHEDLTVWSWAQEALGELTDEERQPPRLITGNDLIRMGYPAGPSFREILEAVTDAQIEGKVRTREAAEKLVLRKFPRKKRSRGKKSRP